MYGSGSLSPQQTYSVYNDSEGKIESIEVSAGDTVQEGDVLVRLSSSDIETNIKTYEKELFSAQVALSEVRDTGSDYYVYAPSAGTPEAGAVRGGGRRGLHHEPVRVPGHHLPGRQDAHRVRAGKRV